MPMDPKRLLGERRRRLVGAILGHCENADWYDELDQGEKNDLRQKVLDSIAAFYDDVLDVVKALDGDPSGVTNQAVWDVLQSIQSDLRRQSPRAARQERALPAEAAGAGTG